jgi:hypothetical protein
MLSDWIITSSQNRPHAVQIPLCNEKWLISKLIMTTHNLLNPIIKKKLNFNKNKENVKEYIYCWDIISDSSHDIVLWPYPLSHHCPFSFIACSPRDLHTHSWILLLSQKTKPQFHYFSQSINIQHLTSTLKFHFNIYL